MKLTYFTECLQSFDHLQSEGSDSETAPTVVQQLRWKFRLNAWTCSCSIRKELSAPTDSVSVNYKYLLVGLLATMGCGFSL